MVHVLLTLFFSGLLSSAVSSDKRQYGSFFLLDTLSRPPGFANGAADDRLVDVFIKQAKFPSTKFARIGQIRHVCACAFTAQMIIQKLWL